MSKESTSEKDQNNTHKNESQTKEQFIIEKVKMWVKIVIIAIVPAWLFGLWQPSMLVILGTMIGVAAATALISLVIFEIDKNRERSSKITEKKNDESRNINTKGIRAAFFGTLLITIILLCVDKWLGWWHIPFSIVPYVMAGILAVIYLGHRIFFNKADKVENKGAEE